MVFRTVRKENLHHIGLEQKNKKTASTNRCRQFGWTLIKRKTCLH